MYMVIFQIACGVPLGCKYVQDSVPKSIKDSVKFYSTVQYLKQFSIYKYNVRYTLYYSVHNVVYSTVNPVHHSLPTLPCQASSTYV